MKKIFIMILTATACVFALSACGNKVSKDKAIDYLGFEPNTTYTYMGEGNDLLSWSYYCDYVFEEDGLYQRRISMSNGIISEVFKYENGKLNNTYAEANVRYFWDMTDKRFDIDLIVLQEPMTVGTEWQRTKIYDSEGNERVVTAKITEKDVDISVPYGDFKALVVEVNDSNGTVTKEYYVKGLGLVRQEATDGTNVYVSELSEITKDTTVELPRVYFYPVETSDIPAYELRTTNYSTNTDALEALNAGFHEYINHSSPDLFNQDAKITAISYSSTGARAKVDFTKDIYPEGITAEQEQMILQSIADTIGFLFYAKEVAITVEGGDYISPNITMKTTEYLTVNELELD